jgi:hypothetical protein
VSKTCLVRFDNRKDPPPHFLPNGSARDRSLPQVLEAQQHGQHPLELAVEVDLVAAEPLQLVGIERDRGFGSPVFGIHLYTWCFIAFSCQIAASAILLIMTAWLKDSKVHGQATMITAAAFAIVVVANLVSVTAEAGLHWNLPADPTGYLLFK